MFNPDEEKSCGTKEALFTTPTREGVATEFTNVVAGAIVRLGEVSAVP
jgi:hypothetical protein